jgi:FKBP-type peptidyl-prolyl cis-trans isomerase
MEMSVGEKSMLTIPAEMAYGNRGFLDLIPNNSSLVFEIELKGIKRAPRDTKGGLEGATPLDKAVVEEDKAVVEEDKATVEEAAA